jgi:ribosomal protein S17E
MTADAYSQGASEPEAQKRVSALLVPKYSPKFGADFSPTANITKAYQVIAQAH